MVTKWYVISLLLCNAIMLHGMDGGKLEYTVRLIDDQEIKVSKELLDQFPSIKTRPNSSLLLDFSNRNYTFDSFTLVKKVAQIISDAYPEKTNNVMPEKINFAVKSQIVQ